MEHFKHWTNHWNSLLQNHGWQGHDQRHLHMQVRMHEIQRFTTSMISGMASWRFMAGEAMTSVTFTCESGAMRQSTSTIGPINETCLLETNGRPGRDQRHLHAIIRVDEDARSANL